MPIDYRDYPENWHEISRYIRTTRAGNRCECNGQCGHHLGNCGVRNHESHPETGSKVVLTVAHWPDRDKHNVSPNNLHALCQRCHLALDRDQHVRNRKFGRYHNRDHQLNLNL